MEEVKVPEGKPIRLLEWLVKVDDWIKYGKPVIVYRHIEDPSTGVKTKELHLKSRHVGRVKNLCVEIGQVAMPGHTLMELEGCTHPVVMKDMCAECGQDLRLLEEKEVGDCARVAMVPNIPELKINNQQAEELGNQDKDRLHKLRKLVLLVDLDQTLIHTTQNKRFAPMCENNKDFFIYNLNKNEPTLYTKIRPHCRNFLDAVSKIFELQIVTFGSRQYAHKIAEFIDPEKKYFAHRILSRDECFNPMQKSGNLRHLFPCGDSMVCIIDDRDDVWNAAPNLVLVKKYSYFPGAGDINSPDKREVKKYSDVSAAKNDKVSPRKRKNESNVEKNSSKVRKSEDNHREKAKEKETDDDDIIKSIIEPEFVAQLENQSNSAETPSSESNPPELPTDSNDILADICASSVPDDNTVQEPNLFQNSDTLSESDKDNINLSNADSLETLFSKDSQNGETCHNSTTDIEDTTDTENITKKTESIENNSQTAEKPALVTEDSTVTAELTSNSTKSDANLPLPDHDDYLLYLQHVLSQVHGTYYEAYDKYLKKEFENPPDLRGVLPFLRSKVLFGCNIVLTGIIPNNYKGRPDQHKAHVTALQLGAVIADKVNEQTTHLIGGKKGTAKYQEAQRLGTVKLVSIDWLWSCSERWEKVSEELFPIPKRKSNSTCSSREGTPPVSKTVKWSADSSPKTYNPVTGKLIKKVLDPSHELAADEGRKRRDKKLAVEIYSSLENPEVVVPMKVEMSTEPSTSAAAVRTRKPSMAEVMGIEYSLSSNDWTEMGKEVDDLLSSDEEDAENSLGTLIENTASSSSEASANQTPTIMDEGRRERMKSDDEDSSSEEEFDHMAEMLDHEMHYDEDDSRDLEALD